MSEHSGASTLVAMTLEEPGAEQASPRAPGPLRCGPCAVWPRQQTWLCAVPLVMGFVGLGLSLMLLKWIVVGSVQDYVPTDLVDPKGSMGQDPIFLSKPSAMPKGPDIPTVTTSAASTTAVVSTTTPLAADGTAPAPRTRSGPPANHSANGSAAGGEGNRTPRLHNRVGTRVGGTAVTTSTARAPRLTPPPSGKEVTPRSTVRKGSAVVGGRNGAGHSKPGQTLSTTEAYATSSTTTTTVRIATKVQTTASQPPPPPVKPTSRWTHGRQGKAPATRPHHRFRTPMAPTQPSLRSEVFKPCIEDKDLAFCLNEGECSIIETVAGVHRHCRCKEGYHGLRCDQFVPKTDAILSDPTADELGIEFMESADTYQRQVLSIFSIASGMCLLGVACMALYRRNKRHRQKLQAHFSESRSLRDCGINASGLMSKSSSRTQYTLQKSCGTLGCAANAAPGASRISLPILSRAQSKGKRFRSNSLSLSPALRRKETCHFRTPAVSRGKLKLPSNLAEASRVSAHVYKHLLEEEPADLESLRRCDPSGGKVGGLLSRTSHFAARKGWTEVPCTRLDKGSSFPPPSLRTRSVPIIPSLQACDLEGRRLDTTYQNTEGRHVPTGSPSSPPYESAVPISVCPQTPSSSSSVEMTIELDQALKQKKLSSPVTESSGSHIIRGGALKAGIGQSGRYSAKEQTGTGIRGLKTAGQGYTSIKDPNGPLAICRGNGNSS
ncbi:pro-neuregulin-3, membrane-bound isoform isoform X1 [Phycodurus eques]|uniref:pro-neuregulin-3, membrane-bound isoform isoform X1 n=1 Tax=Phycodurus eques TaxID=693459 RepID=UPI002ACE1266|nr:pro-neuregulin-3, membrane-bound isoform isoform X1 [Phycodurus eques]